MLTLSQIFALSAHPNPRLVRASDTDLIYEIVAGAAGSTATPIIGNFTGVVTSVNKETSIADNALSIAKTASLSATLNAKSDYLGSTFNPSGSFVLSDIHLGKLILGPSSNITITLPTSGVRAGRFALYVTPGYTITVNNVSGFLDGNGNVSSTQVFTGVDTYTVFEYIGSYWVFTKMVAPGTVSAATPISTSIYNSTATSLSAIPVYGTWSPDFPVLSANEVVVIDSFVIAKNPDASTIGTWKMTSTLTYGLSAALDIQVTEFFDGFVVEGPSMTLSANIPRMTFAGKINTIINWTSKSNVYRL